MQNPLEIKSKILETLNKRGPSLPVHIARETGMSMLFASAFLSELISEKRVRTSNMRIGGSPLYLIPGKEFELENFGDFLKSKEKEAFLLLKERKFLKDTNQEPAIRVALRSIRDFAMPFKKDEEIFWRYFKTNPEEFQYSKKILEKHFSENKETTKSSLEKKEIKQIPKETTINLEPKPSQEIALEEKITKQKQKSGLDIFDKPTLEKKEKKKVQNKKTSSKQNEKFFNKVKDFLAEQSIEIADILSFNKDELILKVKNPSEKILIAYNKKRLAEKEIISAYKKASEYNLPYILISFGEPLKKTQNLIEALKNLDRLEKIE